MQIEGTLSAPKQAVQRRRDILLVLHYGPQWIGLSRTLIQVLKLSPYPFSRNGSSLNYSASAHRDRVTVPDPRCGRSGGWRRHPPTGCLLKTRRDILKTAAPVCW